MITEPLIGPVFQYLDWRTLLSALICMYTNITVLRRCVSMKDYMLKALLFILLHYPEVYYVQDACKSVWEI